MKARTVVAWSREYCPYDAYNSSLLTPRRNRSAMKKKEEGKEKKNEEKEVLSSSTRVDLMCMRPFRSLVVSVSASGDGRSRPVVHEGGRGQHPRRVIVGICRRAQQPSGSFALNVCIFSSPTPAFYLACRVCLVSDLAAPS